MIAILLSLTFTIAGILVALNRFWQYEVFYYDFGIYDSALSLASRLQPPIIDHLVVGGKWIFADHLSPSIFLLAPFYWLTDRIETLLILQAIIVGLSGFVIYSIGNHVLKNKLLSLSILTCYFLFTGLQNAIISDFHEITVITLPLALIFWAFIRKRIVLYFIFLLLTLGCKESTFLLGIGIGIAVYLLERSWWRISLFTIIASIFWGILSIKIIIPFFSGAPYSYSPQLSQGILEILSRFFDNPTKINTLFYSFGSFGFLPLFNPQFWFLYLQDFATRFLPEYSNTRWTLGLHYSAQISPLLAVGAIFTLKHLRDKLKRKKLLQLLGILLIANAIIIYRFILHGPLALSYNPAFYSHTRNFEFLNTLISKIPKNASVMAQNNIAPHFTRQKVYLFRDEYYLYQPDYILLDLRPQQNLNNFFGVKNLEKTLERLLIDPDYVIVYKTQYQFIFKKNML